MNLEEVLYFYYAMSLGFSNSLFINHHETYYGIPDAMPDILDSNGMVVVKGEDINKIIIKAGTKMMEKYPVGIYFGSFKLYVEQAIESEKKKREK